MVLCERVIVDAQSNNTTLVTCLDQVNAAYFPSEHHGFAVAAKYRWVGDAEPPEMQVEHRLVRCSAHGPEEVIAQVGGQWRARSRRGRVNLAFGVVRLLRPETVEFRLDHRIGDRDWVVGPSSYLDVQQWDLAPEQRAELRAAFEAQGQPVPESLRD
jgi:hypothetical protein